MIGSIIRFFLDNKLMAYLAIVLVVGWGLSTAPFDFNIPWIPKDPVTVDAIPDIGENQQIVFTRWAGRSPQDVEDQITYPLSTALLGIPGVKSIRSNSMFGFSSIYLIFNEDIEFYWSRSRILEKLNALPSNVLPEGVQPSLGPDATALGQIFWYTLEGRDPEGKPTGGWDLHELRSLQDFYVRYGLSSAEGVSEVASIGGFVKEYQVDVDPEILKSKKIGLTDVMRAIKASNLDIGAQTIEINQAEYFVRGLGYVKSIEDLEESVIRLEGNVPIRIKDVGRVYLGPATRRGILDKSGAEAVGGVVVARYGANPLEVINNVKTEIARLEPGMPVKTLEDGTISKVKIIPFYDRTELIKETIGTLEEALTLEILITIIVVILLLMNLRSSLLIAGTLPVAVLMCFIAMKYVGVDANIVALSGIAIAIGTMVDMGIVLTENITDRLAGSPEEDSLTAVYEASKEVGSAIVTAVSTTVISFLPVFGMEAAEGKLFRPLAYTKTFALIAAVIVAICFIPPLAHSLLSIKLRSGWLRGFVNLSAVVASLICYFIFGHIWILLIFFVAFMALLKEVISRRIPRYNNRFLWLTNFIYAGIVVFFLSRMWMPLGVNVALVINIAFVALLIVLLLGAFGLVIRYYESILGVLLKIKWVFLLLISLIIYAGFTIFQKTGQEFMPALDEGSFLLMPTAMPHAGIEENKKNLRLLDMAVTAIPEVESVVGKAGRVESPLDPAPMSMYENVILYKSEYRTDENGHKLRFKVNAKGDFIYDEEGEPIPDSRGLYYRQWRDEIKSPDDIWNAIVRATKIPGVTSAPKLQPIETRLVMLQTGMRAPMGIKVRGTDLRVIEKFGFQLEEVLKEVDGVKAAAVFAERIVGKPYLLIDIDRKKISQYGLTIDEVQQHIQAAVGGMAMTSTVEGRERYKISLRYPRDYRDNPESLKRVFVRRPNGDQIALGELVNIRYEQGPQAIKSEDGFLVGYVLFDRDPSMAEVTVVQNAQQTINDKIASGELVLPAGVNYHFAGTYEQQVRANKRLSLLVPVALMLIFVILYLQFKSTLISLMVFSGVFVAFAGGFIMIWCYGEPWFLNFSLFGTNMRDLFQIETINLSVAVWVGFLALFGIATDDGVLVATFLKESFARNEPNSIAGIRSAVIEGGKRRVRPAMMTTATTILALLPVLSSSGRGADIMLPMAIPSFGGMTLQVLTMFTVPVLYALWKETSFKLKNNKSDYHGTTDQ